MTLTQELNMTTNTRNEAATHLQSDWAGIRLSFGRMGTRKTFTPGQRATAADEFDADAGYISAGKKLIDTNDPAFKAVGKIFTKARETWTDCTLPYPEPGVRLIKQDRIDGLTSKLAGYQVELADAVTHLEERYDELRERSREKLGDLYNPADYPATLEGLFRIEWDLPSLAPPEYLMGNPQLYAEQSAKIAARFNEAVGLAEDAFAEQLFKLIDNLTRKLSGLDDGTEKVLHGSTIDNMMEFFSRFKTLNLHSSAELDKLVEQAEAAISGKGLVAGKPVTRDELEDSATLRRDVASQLSAVSATLEGMMVAKPRRAINRRAKPEAAPSDTPTE